MGLSVAGHAYRQDDGQRIARMHAHLPTRET